MLGFPIPEHDAAGVSVGHALPSPDRDLDLYFDLTSLCPCAACAASGEGWVDWHAGRVLGDTSAGTDTGVVGKYAGNGTIDSVLGGGGNSPDKFEEHASSCVHRFGRYGGVKLQISRAAAEGECMDDEGEEDVMSLLLRMRATATLCRSRDWEKVREGKIVDGVVESLGCISPVAAAGARIRRMGWRKAFADEA